PLGGKLTKVRIAAADACALEILKIRCLDHIDLAISDLKRFNNVLKRRLEIAVSVLAVRHDDDDAAAVRGLEVIGDLYNAVEQGGRTLGWREHLDGVR